MSFYEIICIIAWGDSGRTQHATPHATRASAQATGSRARCTRSAGPHNAMHARGSTPHPRPQTASPTHHHNSTTNMQQPTTQLSQDIHRPGGRAGTLEKRRDREQGTRPPSKTGDAQQTSRNPCLLPKARRSPHSQNY